MVAVAQQAGTTRRQTDGEPTARLARWAPRTRETKRLGWTQ
jgi:hypothetical protein